MRIENLVAVASGVFLAALPAYAQSTFQNLDFEQANPINVGTPLQPFFVTSASALPYWTVTIGGVLQTTITENAPSTGTPWVMLVGPSGAGGGSGSVAIDGDYSVLLQSSYFSSLPSISQTGTIPVGTQSLLFEAEPGLGTLDVFIGTQIVSFSAIGSEANYTLYAAGISAWAGDTEQLTFTALESDSGMNNWEIDDISFSPNAVPEPSPPALTGIGGMLFALWRRFAPKRP